MPRKVVNSVSDGAEGNVESIVTEGDMTEIVEETAEEVSEETPAETPAVKFDWDSVPEGSRAMVEGLKGTATGQHANYMRVYEIVQAGDDRDKLLAAARGNSENDDVKSRVAEAAELQSRIAALLAEADEILIAEGKVKVLSSEELAAANTELQGYRKAFGATVNFVEETLGFANFSAEFTDLPGTRRRAASSDGTPRSYTPSTDVKPKISHATVNGAEVKNPQGSYTFTALAQYLRKDSGKMVQVGDLHKAWMTAAGKDNPAEIVDEVFFDFSPDGVDKSYRVSIKPKESA